MDTEKQVITVTKIMHFVINIHNSYNNASISLFSISSHPFLFFSEKESSSCAAGEK